MTICRYPALLLLLATVVRADAPPAEDTVSTKPRRVEVALTEAGFSPSPIPVKAGEAIELVVTRRTDRTCAREIVVAGADIRRELPLDKPVVIALTAPRSGELRYACGMDMVRGALVVEAAQPRIVALMVTEEGFVPSHVTVARGEETRLVVTRKTDKTCARDILIPSLGVRKALPLGEAVEVTITPDKAGELKFGCAMNGMIGGVIMVE